MSAPEIKVDPEVMILLLQAVIGRFGEDHTLLIPNYKKALASVPSSGRLWVAVVGDDFLIGMDAEGEQLVAIEDFRGEKETVH